VLRAKHMAQSAETTEQLAATSKIGTTDNKTTGRQTKCKGHRAESKGLWARRKALKPASSWQQPASSKIGTTDNRTTGRQTKCKGLSARRKALSALRFMER